MHNATQRQLLTQDYIAYTSNRSGHYDIWLFNVRNGANVRVTNQLADSFSTPEWSRDNTKIAFVGKNRIIYVINLSTSKMSAIDQLDEQDILSLHWSPDSRTLVYSTRNQIVLYDVTSHRAQSIKIANTTYPQFFPSGREILFEAPDSNGISQLYRIATNGTGKTQITNNREGPLHDIKLSPDGTFVLYTTPGASISLIRTVELKTGEVFEIEGGPLAKNYSPTWSPNGNTIAYSATIFTENQGYSSQIRTVGKRGFNDRIIARSTCFSSPDTWSESGTMLAYLSGCTEQEYASEMWIVDMNSRRPVKVVEGGTITALQWSKSRIMLGAMKLYSNSTYRVRFSYPSHWQQVTDVRYEGFDGFFQVAAASGNSLKEVCDNEAFHQLMPYGSNPQIYRVTIQNQGACLIFPSQDQPVEMNNQAALIEEYPTPIEIDNTMYNFLIIWADRNHLNEIASTVRLT